MTESIESFDDGLDIDDNEEIYVSYKTVRRVNGFDFSSLLDCRDGVAEEQVKERIMEIVFQAIVDNNRLMKKQEQKRS